MPFADRLRAAREKAAKEAYEDVNNPGCKWAKSTATPKDLKRLERYVNSGDGSLGWWDVDFSNWCAPFVAVDYLVFALRLSAAAPNRFWTEALGDETHRIQDGDFPIATPTTLSPGSPNGGCESLKDSQPPILTRRGTSSMTAK